MCLTPGGAGFAQTSRCGLDAVASYTVSHRGTFIYKLLLRMHCWEWRELYGGPGAVEKRRNRKGGPTLWRAMLAAPRSPVDGECKCCFTLMVANARAKMNQYRHPITHAVAHDQQHSVKTHGLKRRGTQHGHQSRWIFLHTTLRSIMRVPFMEARIGVRTRS